jgi:hypothetical protein
VVVIIKSHNQKALVEEYQEYFIYEFNAYLINLVDPEINNHVSIQ